MYERTYYNDDLSQYSFLVTGGAGFVGSNIVEYLLKHGAKLVRVLDNLSEGYYDNLKEFEGNPAFEFLQGDITVLEDCHAACKGIDYVTHQAALGSVPRSIKTPEKTNKANVDGFLNMIIAARDANVKRFVYASSSSVYGDSPALPKLEDNIGNPLSPYAVSKYVNELYAGVFHKCYGMEVIGLRYFNIFGPKQSPKGAYAAVIPLFIQGIFDNNPPYINGDGEQTRDFTFVENAVQANVRAMFSSHPGAIGQVFNIAVGDRITINLLFNELARFAGSEMKAIHRDDREGDIRNSLADISKARELIGYNPQIKVEEGLKLTLDWFTKQR
jgi:UDP-N-acetylglucosamine/UDP-N-acetylgalactosamine 4-epimerase